VLDPVSQFDYDARTQRHTGRRRAARRNRHGALYGSAALLAVVAAGLFMTVVRGVANESTRPVADPAVSSSAAPSTSDDGVARLTQIEPSGGPAAAPPSSTAAPSGKTTGPAPARTSAKPAPPGNTSYEDQVVTLVNQQRATAGCKALTVDSRLTTAARGHSQDMANRDYFDHNTPEGVTPWTRITNAGYHFSAAAENIAAGQTTPASVMNAWMNSPGHRANILNCNLRNIGVGLAYNAKHTPYWTQDFGTPG
jgi:uncharacterized protein YkwD